MADTMQIVRWSLAQTCKLRDADSLGNAEVALVQTSYATLYAKLSSVRSYGHGVYGDICVTSSTHAASLDPKRMKSTARTAYLPSGGFLISEQFHALGGAAGLREMCRACPANTDPTHPAGCTGTLYQYPASEETQAQLESILSRLGLTNAFADHFPVTTPLWYGLWARSPLSPRATDLLSTIISAMHDEDANETTDSPDQHNRHLADLSAFVRATELSARHDLPLHVSLAPLGHTDFGVYTIFPHCPFCKAPARIHRWQRQYPTQLYSCPACGTQYSPAETSFEERDRHDDHDNLRKILGPERYTAFTLSCLVESGLTEPEARDVLAAHEAWEQHHRLKAAQERDRARRQSQFLHSTLFLGLHPTYEEDDPDDEPTDDLDKLPYFSPDDFATMLRRCREMDIKIVMMLHRSESQDLDRNEFGRLSNPEQTFADWRAQGCNERFAASFKVPDPLLPPPT